MCCRESIRDRLAAMLLVRAEADPPPPLMRARAGRGEAGPMRAR